MSIKISKQYSGRGSIKDLKDKAEIKYSKKECLDTSVMLRMQKLYEYAENNKDKKLQISMGFITTDSLADKNAISLSICSLRQIVNDIKSRAGSQIEHLQNQFSKYFSYPEPTLVKNASAPKFIIFRRASKL